MRADTGCDGMLGPDGTNKITGFDINLLGVGRDEESKTNFAAGSSSNDKVLA